MNFKRFRGQNLYLFLGLLPAMMLLFSAVIDFGRFMLLHAQVASMADSAALAAANALDIKSSSPGHWELNSELAHNLAKRIFINWNTNRLPYEEWMQIRMEQIDVMEGSNRVRVVVVGECQPLFLGAIGVSTYTVRVVSYARAAVGIINEDNSW
jgi:hypothetical protein